MKLKRANHFIKGILLLLILISCGGDDDTSPAEANPSINVIGNFTSFSDTDVLSFSESQNIQVSASNLTSNLNVTTTTNFQVSLDNQNFSNQLSVTSTTINETNQTIYVRFSPTLNAVGAISGNITFESTGANPVTKQLNGNGLSIDPMIGVSDDSLVFETMIGNTSDPQQIIVDAGNLDAVLEIGTTVNFEISLDNITYSNSIQVQAETANAGFTLFVRFSPQELGEILGTITLQSTGATDVEIGLLGTGTPVVHTYYTFDQEPLAFGSGFSQSAFQTFTLHSDVSNISQIKMYLEIDCPGTGCDDWDRYANVMVKDPESNTWYEIGRYITPYWVGTEVLPRGLEFDVTDFKSLLTGDVELRIYIENWTTKADLISIEFDYIQGTPDYEYYAIAEVMQYNGNSLEGVPYGVSHNFDLDRTVSLPANSQEAHLRTLISGWGHATPSDPDGRPCAEWCYRTHRVKINGTYSFEHSMEPIGCASNPLNNQNPGNWQPDRAGWCPGMAVPYRVDALGTSMSGNSFSFEYEFENWVSNGVNGDAFYAISTFVVVKSTTPISKPTVN
ncbi:peptide-N-glycosidase F-related protein [Winogradskyella sp.]|uniref:peptide-N-glycosidase F-related protein n=1 Tax=Winogradskyella sp. TaxID=1883156 RepID=UPI003BAD8E91